MEQVKIMSEQILGEIYTKLRYMARFFMKEVTTQFVLTFELGTQE